MKKNLIVCIGALFMILLCGCGEYIVVNGVSYRVLSQEEERAMVSFARLTLLNSGEDMTAAQRNYITYNESIIENGLAKAKLSGRFEICDSVIFDGAHTYNSIKLTLETLDALYPGKTVNLLFACAADKDIKDISLLFKNKFNKIYLTIPGGSDNSYTETLFPTKNVKDYSQWNHYYSRDGGITWHLYDRSVNGRTEDGNSTYIVLNQEGSREILIKALDGGVEITSATLKEGNNGSEYTEKAYNDGTTHKAKMDYYSFVDSTGTTNGWNLSDAAENDEDKAEKIALLIYGKTPEEVNATDPYKHLRDRRIAYLDRTSPVVSLFGEKLYVHEFGCSNLDSCKVGYKEQYAGAQDYSSNVSKENPKTEFEEEELIYSKFINNNMFVDASGNPIEGKYQGNYDENLTENLTTKSTESSGLGSDGYIMNGAQVASGGKDIREMYSLNRMYIIYSFDDTDPTVYDLSNTIPTSKTSTDGEDSIYDIIGDPKTYTQDFSYTIVYIVYDNAGNESVYVSRGVIYVSLVPEIEVAANNNDVEAVSENTYSLSVEQGTSVEEVVNNLKITAEDKSNFLTQTIYYNGELVVDDKKYQKNIYDGFTTNVPGVYEITYNLRYMHYDKDGNSELIEALPVKLTITVEATPPIVESDASVNYTSYLIMVIGVLMAGLALCYFGLLSKKRS